ncbi:MAG: sugar phosphate isomerase/epimerase [Treponema sp.]|nr:sugar phosphate isomerase/epimerase [Treponema sp.]
MLAMTSDFHGESRKSAEIHGALVRIAKTGFSHVHWCHEWTGSYVYSVYEMLQIREWCGELGLAVKGVHASSGENNADLKHYVSPNEYNRLAGLELIKNRVDLAHLLDAEAIVLHLDLPWQRFEAEKDYRDHFYKNTQKSFDELESYCTSRRIRVCVENGIIPPAHTRYMFDTLFSRYNNDYMGLCFDTGHANIMCGENRLEFAERYNDRLFMIHIHDNKGKEDEHLLPFTGSFDWEGFAPVLARSPYRFPLLVESSYREAGDDTAWLEKAFLAGSRFTTMTQKYR